MNNSRADGATVASLQVFHDARLTEGVKTLGNGGGVDEIAGTQAAHNVLVDGFHAYTTLHRFFFSS